MRLGTDCPRPALPPCLSQSLPLSDPQLGLRRAAISACALCLSSRVAARRTSLSRCCSSAAVRVSSPLRTLSRSASLRSSNRRSSCSSKARCWSLLGRRSVRHGAASRAEAEDCAARASRSSRARRRSTSSSSLSFTSSLLILFRSKRSVKRYVLVHARANVTLAES